MLFIWEESYVSKGYSSLEIFDWEQDGVRPFHGVGYKPHPRGRRIGFWNWDFPGLQSAVFLDGTINDDSDRDRGWTVEIALPWSEMGLLTRGKSINLTHKRKTFGEWTFLGLISIKKLLRRMIRAAGPGVRTGFGIHMFQPALPLSIFQGVRFRKNNR